MNKRRPRIASRSPRRSRNPVETRSRRGAEAVKIAREAAHTGAPAFRILRAGTARQALKLEAFWWTRLGELAAELGMPTANLVFDLLSHAPDAANRTAFIRRCVGAALHGRVGRMAEGAAALRDLVRMAPTPAFIAANFRGLIDINGHALRQLERRLLRHEQLDESSVAIRSRTELDGLFAALRNAAPSSPELGLRLDVGNALLNVTVRAALVPATAPVGAGPEDLAICFLL